MAVKVRELPVEEWDKLRDLPFGTNGLPNPAGAAVLVAEDGDEIVGVWCAGTFVVLEGLWVKEEYRKTTFTAAKLLVGMKALLRALGIPQVVTLVQTEYVKKLAEKAGFNKVDGEVMELKL